MRGVVFKADQAGLELAIESVAREEWFVALAIGRARHVKAVDEVARVVLIVQGDQARLVFFLIVNDLQHSNVRVSGGYLRERQLVSMALFEVHELHASAVPDQNECLLETRSWNDLHSHAKILLLYASHLCDLG